MSDDDQFGTVDDVVQALGLGRSAEPSAEFVSSGNEPEREAPVESAQPEDAEPASDTGEQDPGVDLWVGPGVPRALGTAEKDAADRAFLERLDRQPGGAA